jgi:hypothetical protein
MILDIGKKLARLGEGDHDNRNAAAVKFSFERSHLDEVRLARQSRQVAQKNNQQPVGEMARQMRRRAMTVKQRQVGDVNFFHTIEGNENLGTRPRERIQERRERDSSKRFL